jgi:hypothetical protein
MFGSAGVPPAGYTGDGSGIPPAASRQLHSLAPLLLYRRVHRPGKLSAEEMAARLADMQGDAHVHEEARWQRLAEVKKKDDREESQQAEHTHKERAAFLENAGKVSTQQRTSHLDCACDRRAAAEKRFVASDGCPLSACWVAERIRNHEEQHAGGLGGPPQLVPSEGHRRRRGQRLPPLDSVSATVFASLHDACIRRL